MKLRHPTDRKAFLMEVGRPDLFEVREEVFDKEKDALFEAFFHRRQNLVRRLANFRRRQSTKSSWNRHRWSFLRGHKRFQRSTQSKRFHRNLGRYLSTHLFRRKAGELRNEIRKQRLSHTSESLGTILPSISSLRTHLFLECEYYMPLEEEVELYILLEYAIPLLNSIELKLFSNPQSPLSEEENELLLRLVDVREFHKALAEEYDISYTELFEKYQLLKESHSLNEEDKSFFLLEFYASLILGFS